MCENFHTFNNHNFNEMLYLNNLIVIVCQDISILILYVVIINAGNA